MQRRFLLLTAVFVFAMVLAACAPGRDNTVLPTGLPTLSNPTSVAPTAPSGFLPATSAPTAAENPLTAGTAIPTNTSSAAATLAPSGGMESTPVGAAANIIPNTGRNQVTHLSALIGYKVADKKGVVLGTASDFIINTCEAHILYIVMDPDASLQVPVGNKVLIPYEVITLGNGTIDTTQQAFFLNLTSDQLTSLPAVNIKTLDLSSGLWETNIRTYWSRVARLSNLTTACGAPVTTGTPAASGTATPTAPMTTGTPAATPTNTPRPASQLVSYHLGGGGDTGTDTPTPAPGGNTSVNKNAVIKVALATELLKAPVRDAAGTSVVATVEEVMIQPESGLLQYMVLRPDETALGTSQAGLIVVPMGAVNIKERPAPGAAGFYLISLVDTKVLQGAPRVSMVPDTSQAGWDNAIVTYWKTYVP